MTRNLILATSMYVTCALGQPGEQIFVPSSPLTTDEIAEQKVFWREELELTESEVDELIGDGSHFRTFRNSEILAALPDFQGSRMLSACSNSIASGATRLVYIADSTEHQVTAKISHCSPVETGLMCSAVETSTYYYYESPENFFSLEGVTLEEAHALLSVYKEHGVENLPEGFFHFSYKAVNSIAATPEGYEVSLGEIYCGGCTAKLVVQIASTESGARLSLVGAPEGMCI